MTAINVNRDEIMAGMVATRERAARERAAAEVKAARADLAADAAARSVEQAQAQENADPVGNPGDWQMLGDVLAGPVLADIVAPNWHLTGEEIQTLSGHICKVLAHYFPNAKGIQSHPLVELVAAFVFIGYARREQVERDGQVVTRFRPMRAGLKKGMTIDDSADGGPERRADDFTHRDHEVGENSSGITTMPG